MNDRHETTIKMVSETVKINLSKDRYSVDATFDFFNSGKTETVTVGFPKSGYGYTASFRSVVNFMKFETWVNGDKIDVQEIPGVITLDGKMIDKKQIDDVQKGKIGGWLEETRWLVKKVTFKGNAKTTTRVKYVVPYTIRNGDERNGEYLYGTGRSWSGNIGKARFIIKASPDISLVVTDFCDGGRYENIRNYAFRRLGEFQHEFVLSDFDPKESERLRFIAIPPWQDWNGPDYRVLRVERRSLEYMSLLQLKIVRNWIYATHGKIFSDPELDKYFRRQDWYKPSKNFKESDLSSLEKENIASIASYENELKNLLHRK